MAHSKGSSSLPRSARGYIAFTITAGAVTALAALGAATGELNAVNAAPALAGAILVLVAGFALQIRSVTLAWKGQSIFVYPDEAVLLLAFLILPPGVVVVAAIGAYVASQAFLRKPLLKASFNVGANAVAIGAAALAYTAATRAGLAGFQSVLFIPLVVSSVNQVLVATLLTLLSRAPLRTILRPELFRSIAISTVIGLTLGFLAVALWTLHPVSAILLLPVGYMFFVAMAAQYRHENELAARRALSRVSERLVGESSEDRIVEAVFEACREAFALREFQVSLAPSGGRERTWTFAAGPVSGGPAASVNVPLMDIHGTRIGEMTLLVASKGATQLRSDTELASLVAGYLSISLGTSQALASLKDAEQRLRDVFDAARDPMLVIEPGGVIVYGNSVALALIEGAGGSRLRPSLSALLDPPSLEQLQAWVAARGRDPDPPAQQAPSPAAAVADRSAPGAPLHYSPSTLQSREAAPPTAQGPGVASRPHPAKGQPERAGETRILEVETSGPPETRRILELKLSPLTLDGDRGALLLTGRDITVRRRLEEEAKNQQETISRSERLAALGILVAGVAHEINNPLFYLRGNIELALLDLAEADRLLALASVEDRPDLEETRRGLESAIRGADQIERISKALKSVARGGAIEREAVDAGEVVREVEELIRVNLPDTVTVRLVRSEAPLLVMANASELHQVLLNLARNAVEAVDGNGGGTVVLSSGIVGDEVEIRVADDGPGISPEIRPQLFTPFMTTKTSGTGLGLSIAHSIVKGHGGTMRVESEPGQGATFFVCLPKAPAPPAA